MTIRLAFACILATGIAFVVGIMQAQDRIPVDPTPLRAPLVTAVQIGDGYGNLDRPFDVRITVLDVLRGEKAWVLIKDAGEFNQPPKTGFEHLLAYIRFEYLAKTGNYTASMDSFSATSADGKEYDTPSIKTPTPAFGGRLYPEDSLEGWIAFLVARDDSKPLMAFGQTGIQGPGRIWFQLH
jgi:hypothetical protein